MSRRDKWLDYKGINLIRIVIGSYFLAISLGLIGGFDSTVMFASILPENASQLAGTMLLFALSVAFMAGVYLRETCLMLAIFVLSSSISEHFILSQSATITPFWRDLTLVCAVLLCYSTLSTSELRRAALVLQRQHARIGTKPRRGAQVKPKRVSVRSRTPRRADSTETDTRTMRPVIAPTAPIRRPPPLSLPAPNVPKQLTDRHAEAGAPPDDHQRLKPQTAPAQRAYKGAVRLRPGATMRVRKLEIPEPDDDFEDNIFLNI